MYQDVGLFIDVAWRPAAGGAEAEVASPVSERSLGRVPAASETDMEDALDAAERGLATDQFRRYAEEAGHVSGRLVESRVLGGRFEVLKKPVGVCAAFTAWNFPAPLVARKVAPALAAGCSVVVRPSSQTPGTAMLIVDCCRAGSPPPGAVSLVTGPTVATHASIMAAKPVRKASLAGSTRVGQQMIRDAAATVKTVSMKLGGNAPLILWDDADLDACLYFAVPTKYARRSWSEAPR